MAPTLSYPHWREIGSNVIEPAPDLLFQGENSREKSVPAQMMLTYEESEPSASDD